MPGKYIEIQPTREFTCPYCGTFSLSVTILSVNLPKNRFTVEWAHFHAHDSPTGQSRQRFRGHTRHGDTTSPDHPRRHRAGHRGRRHRSAPAEQHTGHRHGHGARHPRLHGQIHARTGQAGDDHGQDWPTFESFKADLATYITYWNTTRRQVKLKGLTPAEYRDQALREAA